MDKIVLYDPGTIIRFELQTDQRVAIQSANNLAPVMDLKFPVIESYARLVGRWIIECKDHMIFMRDNGSNERDDCMVISFQEPRVVVNVKSSSAKENTSSCFQSVSRIDVYPREVGKIKIQTSEQSSQMAGHEEACPVEQNPRPVTTQTEHALVRQLQSDLEREKKAARHLQEMVGSKLDELQQAAEKSKQYLASENRSKLQALETLNSKDDRLEQELQTIAAQMDEANQRIDAKNAKIQVQKEKLDSIQNQLDELDFQEELVVLDCDAAQARLEEMKARVESNADTLVLLENGYQLRHGTISKALEEMNKEIEKVEKRIAFILKFRTKFDQKVEDAIFSGDGTILTSDETGEDLDGIGNTTSS